MQAIDLYCKKCRKSHEDLLCTDRRQDGTEIYPIIGVLDIIKTGVGQVVFFLSA